MIEPRITLIIPTWPGAVDPPALLGMEGVARAVGPIEVILARGRAASRQRNQAAALATAPVLYFLDDDSSIEPETVLRGLRCLEDGGAGVGGPAVTWERASFWERCFGELASSRFAALRIRARAVPVGVRRQVDGEELILCNLMLRRSWFERVRGLDERLHPGEETDLLRRLHKEGAELFYDPDMVVARGRRRHIAGFWLQQFRYGRGRGSQFLRSLRPRDWVFTVPTLFTIYLLFCVSLKFWLPLELYALLAIVESVAIGLRRGSSTGLACFWLFPLLHTAYGLGFLVGLVGPHFPARSRLVELERRQYGY